MFLIIYYKFSFLIINLEIIIVILKSGKISNEINYCCLPLWINSITYTFNCIIIKSVSQNESFFSNLWTILSSASKTPRHKEQRWEINLLSLIKNRLYNQFNIDIICAIYFEIFYTGAEINKKMNFLNASHFFKIHSCN